jgi:hypothetical protein
LRAIGWMLDAVVVDLDASVGREELRLRQYLAM